MKINGEDVELVEAFEQLRVADVVWVWPCPCPHGKHRATLIRRGRGPVRTWRDGGPQVLDYFAVLPPSRPPCVPENSTATTITPLTIAGRVVYRVVDPRKTTGEDVAQGQRDTQPARMADRIEQLINQHHLDKPFERK